MAPTLTPTPHHAWGLQNPLCRMIDKERPDFTREDLMKVIGEAGIECITFHYTALDGRYKELRLPICSRSHAERILAEGERVDGSGLFPGLVDTAASDLYVAPLYRTAFFNPFDDTSLDFTCRYLDREGTLAPFAPDTILHNASRLFHARTGMELEALGELEFYLFSDALRPVLYANGKLGHYHAAAPYAKNGEILDEMVRQLAIITGAVKYGHSEVGTIDNIESEVEELRGKSGEQLEVEFLPMPLEDCGDALVLARWLIRTIAWRHGAIATFAPKLTANAAGNGMHVHMQLTRDGRNVMVEEGGLSNSARSVIGGLCQHAASLTAFGNTVASSYMRLVPDQEAPTRICWSDCNRNAMIRVPLGWTSADDLASIVNPQQGSRFHDSQSRQTVELRTPDGSALVHLLLAGIAVAAERGLASESALKTAARLYLGQEADRNGHNAHKPPALPKSCVESARLLRDQRAVYERDGVFPASVIDYVSKLLNAEDDEHLTQALAGMKNGDREAHVRRILHKDLHRH